MICVSDSYQVERRIRREEVLDRRVHEPDVADTQRLGLFLANVEHVLLLVDGPDLLEDSVQGEGHLSAAARQIEEPAAAGQLRSREQVVDQGGRIRDPEALVVVTRSPVEIPTEFGLGHVAILTEAGVLPRADETG